MHGRLRGAAAPAPRGAGYGTSSKRVSSVQSENVNATKTRASKARDRLRRDVTATKPNRGMPGGGQARRQAGSSSSRAGGWADKRNLPRAWRAGRAELRGLTAQVGGVGERAQRRIGGQGIGVRPREAGGWWGHAVQEKPREKGLRGSKGAPGVAFLAFCSNKSTELGWGGVYCWVEV